MGMPMGPIVYSLCFILEIQKPRRTPHAHALALATRARARALVTPHERALPGDLSNSRAELENLVEDAVVRAPVYCAWRDFRPCFPPPRSLFCLSIIFLSSRRFFVA